MRPLAHVPKAISFHPRNGVLEASGDQHGASSTQGLTGAGRLPPPKLARRRGSPHGSGRVGPGWHDADDVGRDRMKRVNGGVSSSERGPSGARANQPVADSFALNVLPALQKLMAAGFVSQRALANELNRRGIPTARGGSRHYTSVRRVLFRLGLLTPGRTSKQAADAVRYFTKGAAASRRAVGNSPAKGFRAACQPPTRWPTYSRLRVRHKGLNYRRASSGALADGNGKRRSAPSM
jgi:hypothetical protein